MKPEPPKEETAKPVTPKIPSVTPQPSSTLSLTLLCSLQELHRRLELAESGLTSHLHVPLGDNGVHECSVHIQKLQVFMNFSVYVFLTKPIQNSQNKARI